MKERKLKKYRCWFKCPYHIKESDMVTDDPYPIYQDDEYCLLGRFSISGYSGYGHSEEGTYCDKCKLPINRKQMHEILKFEKDYKKLDRKWIKASNKVKKIWVEQSDFFGECKKKVQEYDETDPNFEKFLEVDADMCSLVKIWEDGEV